MYDAALQDTATPAQRLNSRIALFVLFIVAFIPNILFLTQPFFQDEWSTIRNALHFFSEETILPYHARYPTLYSYLAAPFIGFTAVVQHFTGLGSSIPVAVELLYYTNPMQLALPARVVSIVMLFGSSLALYLFLSQRESKQIGALAAVLLATPTTLLNYGSYGLPETTLLLFCALSLLALLKALEVDETLCIKYIALSAAFCGLAVSAKYSALSSAVPIAFLVTTQLVLGKIHFTRYLKLGLTCSAIFILAFLIGTPGWILDTQHFFDEFMLVREQSIDGHLGFSGTPILGQLELLLMHAPILSILCLVGILIAVSQRSLQTAVVMVSIVASLLLSASNAKQSIQFLYPALPGMVLLAVCVPKRLSFGNKWLLNGFTFGLLVLCLTVSYFKSFTLLSSHTTTLARSWINEQIPSGSAVSNDWAYVPTLYSPEAINRIEQHSTAAVNHIKAHNRLFDLIPIQHTEHWLDTTNAEYIVTSSLVFDRFFEFGTYTRTEPTEQDGLHSEFTIKQTFYTALLNSADWQTVKRFDTGNGPDTLILKRVEQ